MTIKFYLLLLFMFILLTIFSSCGGDSNITNPISINTATPDLSGYNAYILIHVKWPQQRERNDINLRGDEKELTASMPSDATLLSIEVLKEDDPNTIIAWSLVERPANVAKIPLKIDLPSMPAIIKAKALDINSNLLSEFEKKITVKYNENEFSLSLGDYSIGLTPTTPGPSNTCDAVINTTLSIVYPNPVGTPAPAASPKPVGNRKINFTVESVIYNGSAPDVTVNPEDIQIVPTKLPLDGNGSGNVMVNATKIKPVTAKIKATLDGTDISNTCYVYLGNFYFWTCVSPDLILSGQKVLRKYDSNGKQLTAFIDIGDDPNQLRYPSSLAIDSSGNFYIAEIMKSTVKKFDSNGNYVNILYNGNVSDICVDSKDNVYVSVNPDNEIRKYDSNGALLNSFKSEEGGMFQPNGIDCEFVLSGDNIYVLYSGNCLVKFDNNGNIIKNWYLNDGAYGDAIIVDKIRKYIYIACFYPVNEIQKFDLVDEKFLTSFARGDTGGRHGVHLGVDQNGYVYKTSYDESSQTVIKKYSPDNNGEFIQQFSIPGCSQIIFVSK